MDYLIYYKYFFPSDLFYQWLSYGDDNYFIKREFAFTLENQVFYRFQPKNNLHGFLEELYRQRPKKIDIGAIFPTIINYSLKNKGNNDNYQPIEKQMVFDLDLTDYDEIRTCCDGGNICSKCWKFMIIAFQILDTTLREDFGWKHLLWVYSGRRGLHCWISDKSTRKFTSEFRNSIYNYLNIFENDMTSARIINGTHYLFSRAVNIITPYFNDILSEQDILTSNEKLERFLSRIDDINVREEFSIKMKAVATPLERWKIFKEQYEIIKASVNAPSNFEYLLDEIYLYFGYPRMDKYVTTTVNHLLKAPFSIHPGTLKVCVPIDRARIKEFDPFKVPTFWDVMENRSLLDEPISIFKSLVDGLIQPTTKVN